MCALMRPRTGRSGSLASKNGELGTVTTVTLIVLTVLLMAFSLIAWRLDNTTLAAIAGTASCTLVADIVRRLLGGPTRSAITAAGPVAAVDDRPSAGQR